MRFKHAEGSTKNRVTTNNVRRNGASQRRTGLSARRKPAATSLQPLRARSREYGRFIALRAMLLFRRAALSSRVAKIRWLPPFCRSYDGPKGRIGSLSVGFMTH